MWKFDQSFDQKRLRLHCFSFPYMLGSERRSRARPRLRKSRRTLHLKHYNNKINYITKLITHNKINGNLLFPCLRCFVAISPLDRLLWNFKKMHKRLYLQSPPRLILEELRRWEKERCVSTLPVLSKSHLKCRFNRATEGLYPRVRSLRKRTPPSERAGFEEQDGRFTLLQYRIFWKRSVPFLSASSLYTFSLPESGSITWSSPAFSMCRRKLVCEMSSNLSNSSA